jgi:hypothetical protein
LFWLLVLWRWFAGMLSGGCPLDYRKSNGVSSLKTIRVRRKSVRCMLIHETESTTATADA